MIVERAHKKQKYLFCRLFIIFFLFFIGLKSIYTTPDITLTILLNTILLFTLPLLLEYFLGLDAYCNFTNFSKIVGIFIHGIAVLFCIFGYVGELELNYNESNHLLNSFTLFNVINLPISILRIFTWLAWSLTIFDFIFVFHPREVEYLNLQKLFNKTIEENIQKNRKKKTTKIVKEEFKQQVLDSMKQTLKTEGGSK